MIHKRQVILSCLVVPVLAWLAVNGFFLVFRETYHRFETIFLDRLFINRYQPRQAGQQGEIILSKDVGSHGFEPIVIVNIDKQTLDTLHEKPLFSSPDWQDRNTRAWPFDRRVTAEALRKIKALGAQLIGVDLLFIHPRNPDEDQALAQAAADCQNVIMASLFEIDHDGSAIYRPPYKELHDASLATGFVNVGVDTDGILRKLLLQSTLSRKEKVQPFSLALMLAHPLFKSDTAPSLLIDESTLRITGSDAITRKVLHLFSDNTNHEQMLINYRGPANTFPMVSFSDLFDPKEEERLRRLFKGKIVLIGLNHPGLQDMYPTPFFSWDRKQTAGVEIHANALYTMLTDSQPSIRTLSGWPHFTIFYLLGLCICLCTSFLGVGVSITVLFLQYAGYWVLANFLFASHLLLPIPVFFIALSLCYILMITARMVTREREKSMIRKVFNQYVSNQVVDELLHHPESLSLGGKALEITTLFSDIRAFTTLSENKSPEQIVHLLNTYFELMVSVITKYNGTINKFIGDAIMVLYGAPVLPGNSPKSMAISALKTAIEMQETLKASSSPELKQLQMGIGISTGVSVVGNIGAQKHKDYTAIGDKINLASRLQGKSQAFEIIVDSGTYEYCKDQFEFEKLEPFTVKGKAEIVMAYKVIY